MLKIKSGMLKMSLVIQAFDDDQPATRDLVRSKDDELVYHTAKEKIEIQIKPLFGFRGNYDKPRV